MVIWVRGAPLLRFYFGSFNLFRVLSEEVIPTFYNRDATGLPRQWIRKMRHAMATVTPKYNTWRMVQDYSRKYYLGN